jgi:23S rRNA maturation mini-RNase III
MTELFREHYDKDALRAIPVLTLAHIGDGVYELLARSAVVARGPLSVETGISK